MAGGGARRSARQAALAEINVTPLVDVMLVLLIIFMVSAPLLTRGIEIGLPQAVSAEPIDEQRVTVTVDRGGQFYVGERPVVDDLLADEVRRLGEGRPVFLRGDRDVPYGRVLEAMDRLRAAGIPRVALVTRPAPRANGR